MAGRSLIRHAATMTRRNFRAYAMLSVTITLSFTLLLCYFAFSDSKLYNTYKKVFSWDRNLVEIWDDSGSQGRYQALLEQLETQDVHAYTAMYAGAYLLPTNMTDQQGRLLWESFGDIMCVPSHVWRLYRNDRKPYEITWLDGRSSAGIKLSAGEALLDDYTFRLLGLHEKEDPVFTFPIRSFSGSGADQTVRIVGTFPLSEEFSLKIIPDSQEVVILDYRPKLILPLEGMEPKLLSALEWGRHVVVYTPNPEQVYQLADEMGFQADAPYLYQNSALKAMQQQKQIKAVISAALFLLLGFNLYSSFNNALNDRKFEIGVKRALGAPKWSIVRQFFYESMLVMLLNILLSVVLTMITALLYKLIYEAIPDQFGIYHEFVLYLSPYSIAMFLTCSVFLSVIFTLIFAYKSTQVQVVDYLKAE